MRNKPYPCLTPEGSDAAEMVWSLPRGRLLICKKKGISLREEETDRMSLSATFRVAGLYKGKYVRVAGMILCASLQSYGVAKPVDIMIRYTRKVGLASQGLGLHEMSVNTGRSWEPLEIPEHFNGTVQVGKGPMTIIPPDILKSGNTLLLRMGVEANLIHIVMPYEASGDPNLHHFCAGTTVADVVEDLTENT